MGTINQASRERRTPKRAARERRIAIIGGGLAGLATAILLARRGAEVVVLERDVRTPAANPEEAFRNWVRRGVAQFRHSHTFLARLTYVMRERLPDVLHLLHAHGSLELALTMSLPPGLRLGPREKGDGELVLLGCRRAAFEWALYTTALREPGVEIREGVLVEGLTAAEPTRAGAPVRVNGLTYRALQPANDPPRAGIPWHPRGLPHEAPSARRTLAAHLVVDATGRRSRADEWLPGVGAAAPAQRDVETGIFYFTRFYRLTGSRPPGATTGLIAGDLGWIKLATFPGDGGTFSITVGSNVDDEPLRALVEPAVFEAMIAAFPQIAPWREPGVSAPIDGPSTPVLVMGGLSNRLRRFVAGRKPLAEGFIPIGDALYHTNPIYGRGATCALLAAVALDDALAAHPDDLNAVALEYHERVRREIEPFWESAAAGDRMGKARAQAQARFGAVGPAQVLELLRELTANPRRATALALAPAVGLFFDRGLAPASRRDPAVFRAVMRVMNMLDEPRTGLLAPALVARVLPYLVESLLWAQDGVAFPGPTRAQALRIVEAARATGKEHGRRAPRRSPARPDAARVAEPLGGGRTRAAARTDAGRDAKPARARTPRKDAVTRTPRAAVAVSRPRRRRLAERSGARQSKTIKRGSST